ncbi:glutamate receptor 2 isoform X2 [Exaiptasia diaphana]|uniref:Ionotropic glutamate receptor C-terminal domain-containing protein n=1 Tax=Exaiptasia diaphana TaxID=2652724 RepID=A0A913YWH9_EXADI|nr:glutamate receptor 2 isoform X2 [Exaiptasia diaphana]
MLCQGADNTPKSLSAFFSFRDTTLGVNSLEDIIKRDYKLFVFAGTPLEETLRTSNFSTYKNLYQKIVSDNSFVKSFDEGVRAVRANSKHLMLEEHPYAESFIHTKPCDLMTVKGFMGVKGYGFAMNKEFPYASNITVAAMKLRETGAIEDLKRKWWNYRSQCHESHEKKPTERLGLEHMVGLYMLVAAGCLLGIISMLFEVLWSAKGEAIKAALPCCFRKEEKEKDEAE